MVSPLSERSTDSLTALLIDGNPLKSIYDICVEKMEMVIKDGEEVLRYRDKK